MFKNRLKELRLERNLSMRGIDSRTKIKFNTYSRYESGERDMSTEILKQLADFFQVTIDYLLCYSGYCLYAKYEKGNFFFKIKEDYYKELKEKKYIYFDDNDNRCIDLNSLVGTNSEYNLMELFKELYINYKLDKATENGPLKSIDELNSVFTSEEIELTKEFVNVIKDAISD